MTDNTASASFKECAWGYQSWLLKWHRLRAKLVPYWVYGVHPLTDAGQVIEPSVSVPSAIGAKFKATATAEPELEPHGLRVTSWALWVCPPIALQPDDEYDERKLAHSLKFALPKIIAPAWRNCLTTTASLLVTLFLSANEPAVVGNVPVDVIF